MKALLCGIMWLVASVSATSRLVVGRGLVNAKAMGGAGGLERSDKTRLGSGTVRTPGGLSEDVEC